MNSEKSKKINIALYVIALAIALFGVPTYAFSDSIDKGYDTGDTAMLLFLRIIPILIAIIVLIFNILSGDMKKTFIILALMFTPWMFMGIVDWLKFLCIYLAEAAVAGAIGTLIHKLISDKIDMSNKNVQKTSETTGTYSKGVKAIVSEDAGESEEEEAGEARKSEEEEAGESEGNEAEEASGIDESEE